MLLSSSCYGKNDGANHQRTQAQIDKKCFGLCKSSIKQHIYTCCGEGSQGYWWSPVYQVGAPTSSVDCK